MVARCSRHQAALLYSGMHEYNNMNIKIRHGGTAGHDVINYGTSTITRLLPLQQDLGHIGYGTHFFELTLNTAVQNNW